MRRISSRVRLVVAGVVAALVVSGIAFALTSGGESTITISARFATAPGLFVGNQVKILGMRVGSVSSVTPGPTYVTVQMVIPSSTKIPSDAQAFIMAPNIINDRFVQLNPPYTGGPTMPNHGLIPESRTAVPVSVDEVIDSLNQFALALGPSGANQHGALSNLLHSAAVAFGPNGSALHSTLLDLGQLFGSLSSQGPDLTDLFDNLGNLSKVAIPIHRDVRGIRQGPGRREHHSVVRRQRPGLCAQPTYSSSWVSWRASSTPTRAPSGAASIT